MSDAYDYILSNISKYIEHLSISFPFEYQIQVRGKCASNSQVETTAFSVSPLPVASPITSCENFLPFFGELKFVSRLADKERVAAALENPALRNLINNGIAKVLAQREPTNL